MLSMQNPRTALPSSDAACATRTPTKPRMVRMSTSLLNLFSKIEVIPKLKRFGSRGNVKAQASVHAPIYHPPTPPPAGISLFFPSGQLGEGIFAEVTIVRLPSTGVGLLGSVRTSSAEPSRSKVIAVKRNGKVESEVSGEAPTKLSSISRTAMQNMLSTLISARDEGLGEFTVGLELRFFKAPTSMPFRVAFPYNEWLRLAYINAVYPTNPLFQKYYEQYAQVMDFTDSRGVIYYVDTPAVAYLDLNMDLIVDVENVPTSSRIAAPTSGRGQGFPTPTYKLCTRDKFIFGTALILSLLIEYFFVWLIMLRK